MKCILVYLAVSCLLACNCTAQVNEPESSAECLDEFQLLIQKVCHKYAVVGSAQLTSTNQPRFSKTIDWFVVEDRGNRQRPKRCYSESRALYPHAPNSNVWEKRYIDDARLFRSMGDFTESLRELTKRDDDDDADRFLRFKSVAFPNLFMLSMITGGSLENEAKDIVRIVNSFKVLNEKKVGEDIVALFFERTSVVEVQFSHRDNYLPIKVKGFFNSRKDAADPEPKDYAIPWFESETKWQKMDDSIWVPIRVTSVLFRDNPRLDRGMEIDARANWQLKFDDALLSDTNVDLLPIGGPIAELRTNLLESGDHISNGLR
jgi:hypothetical protein